MGIALCEDVCLKLIKRCCVESRVRRRGWEFVRGCWAEGGVVLGAQGEETRSRLLSLVQGEGWARDGVGFMKFCAGGEKGLGWCAFREPRVCEGVVCVCAGGGAVVLGVVGLDGEVEMFEAKGGGVGEEVVWGFSRRAVRGVWVEGVHGEGVCVEELRVLRGGGEGRLGVWCLSGGVEEVQWSQTGAALDGDPVSYVDVGGWGGFVLERGVVGACGGLGVWLSRVGEAGSLEVLRGWLGAWGGEVEVRCAGSDVWRGVGVERVWLDGSASGVVVGVVGVMWEFSEVVEDVCAVRVRLDVPVRPFPLGVLEVFCVDGVPKDRKGFREEVVVGRDGGVRPWSEDDVRSVLGVARGWDPEEFGVGFAPRRHVAPLGVPGMGSLAAVCADGSVLCRMNTRVRGGRSAALRVGLGLGRGQVMWSQESRDVVREDPDGLNEVVLRGTWEDASGSVEMMQRVLVGTYTAHGVPVCVVQLSVRNVGDEPVCLPVVASFGCADELWRLPLRWGGASISGEDTGLFWEDGCVAVVLGGLWQISSGALGAGEWRVRKRFRLGVGGMVSTQVRVVLGDERSMERLGSSLGLGGVRRQRTAAQRAVLGVQSVQGVKLPGLWDGLMRDMWSQASLFFGTGGKVSYGIFPSVYDGCVFGVEEDYALYGLACWGFSEGALRGLLRTYVCAEHLDPAHRLYDLRNGLVPWQVERILGLLGASWEDTLTPQQRDLLRSLGEWTLSAIADVETLFEGSDAQWCEDAQGTRVFRGLLPASRYGGDLDFRTQSLTANAANCAGLQALARLTSGEEAARWQSAAHAMRSALKSAWEQLQREADEGVIPLHTGGGDAGSYDVLMKFGILDPLDWFDKDDPISSRLDRWLEDRGDVVWGLPRFDDWSSSGWGIDAHYAVGYLIRALRSGRVEVFWTGLCALVGVAMDATTHTWREVQDLWPQPSPPGYGLVLPSRFLARSEPCIGGLGVALQLVRSALVVEMQDAGGVLGRGVRVCAGVLPSWWSEEFTALGLPTRGGCVSIVYEPRGSESGVLSLSALDVDVLHVHLPRLHDRTIREIFVSGSDGARCSVELQRVENGVLVLDAGQWELELMFEHVPEGVG